MPVERPLPARTVFLWQEDGFQAHQAAYAKTAASDALSATGVYDSVAKLVGALLKLANDDENTQQSEALAAAFQHVLAHGLSVAVSLPEGKAQPYPRLTLVLHDGEQLKNVLEQSLALAKQQVMPDSPQAPQADAKNGDEK
ncbi:MAG: hypothetical protein K8R36_19455, partial [Planctomycetales bacterium]|nr:hypothetical protein [Planctomycetales bacterium]